MRFKKITFMNSYNGVDSLWCPYLIEANMIRLVIPFLLPESDYK